MAMERIFIDTNLFLRYITDDVPEQADVFERLLKKAAMGESQLVTNTLVIAEIVWTLESYYKVSKEDIRSKILAILNTPGLEVAENEILLQTTLWYAEKNVDFIDAYHAAWMTTNRINLVSTFDQKHFSRFTGISVHLPE